MPEQKNKLIALLLPAEPRDFPFRRGLRSVLRALHILTTGVLLGGYVFAQGAEALAPWLIASITTGLVLFATDLHASCAILLEVRGLAVFAKVLLTALVGAFPSQGLVLLTCALFIGAISSHMPGRYRHKIWFNGTRVAVDNRYG